jgi:hypothetical protein
MNLPAYGALNVWKVAAGTGEALPGPVDCEISVGATRPITGQSGKWAWCRVGVGGGHMYRLSRADNRTVGDGKGRCFVHASRIGKGR